MPDYPDLADRRTDINVGEGGHVAEHNAINGQVNELDDRTQELGMLADDHETRIVGLEAGSGGSGPVDSDDITDATATGIAVLTAVDAAAARTAVDAPSTTELAAKADLATVVGNYATTASLAAVATSGSASDLITGSVAITLLPVGGAESQVAAGNHTHTADDVGAIAATTRNTANGVAGLNASARLDYGSLPPGVPVEVYEIEGGGWPTRPMARTDLPAHWIGTTGTPPPAGAPYALEKDSYEAPN